MAELLLGKPAADALVEQIRGRVAALAEAGAHPKLAILRVGEREDDIAYERGATKRAAACGVEAEPLVLAADASTDDVLAAIARVNGDDTVHGCLLFLPLPAGIDQQAVCEALDPAKDVDGMTRGSLAHVMSGTGEGFAPCTAAACIALLDHYRVPIEGARAAVIGRSLVIGKPVAHLLLDRNATVCACHSRTRGLADITRQADIVICATGRARAYGSGFFSPGQTVIDVGINFDDAGAMCGDVDFDAVEPTVAAITPVPRGVGSVTTAVLMSHVVEACERALARAKVAAGER